MSDAYSKQTKYFPPVHPTNLQDAEADSPILDPSVVEDPREALYKGHRELCASALSLMLKKNADYASQSDPYRNFRMFGPLGVLVRLSDKLARLRGFEERGTFSVTDESLDDTILDAINYAVIYRQMKQEGK